jgi:hypothetical protein
MGPVFMYLWRAVQFWGPLWGPTNWAIYMPPHWKLFGGGLWSRCEATAWRTFAAGEGEPLPNAERLPNSDPALSQAGTDLLGLIECQLSQCKCIVKPRTMSYSNGKQLGKKWHVFMTRQVDEGRPPFRVWSTSSSANKHLPADFNSLWLTERKHNHHK